MVFERDGEIFRHGDRVAIDLHGDLVEGVLVERGEADGPALGLSTEGEGGQVNWWLYRRGEWLPDHSDLRHIELSKSKSKRVRKSQLRKTSTQSTALAQAIRFLKSCEYGATHIKVELEGDTGWSANTLHDFILEDLDSSNFNYLSVEYDGSVGGEGTEVQATVPIDHPEYVVELIEVCNKAARENGLKHMDNPGAGMHISILHNTSGGLRGNSFNSVCRRNFRNAMTPLLPALLFLASEDHHSRGLDYRHLQVSPDKFSAIHEHSGFYEFRVFETCYKHPERFYDFLCVIANAMQFYTHEPKLPHFAGKIGRLGFDDDGESVGRFYRTYSHYEALREGVKILAPSYKTFSQLKKERNVKLNATKLKQQMRSNELEWAGEFKRRREEAIAERRAMRAKINKNKYISDLNYVVQHSLRDHYQYSPYSFTASMRKLLEEGKFDEVVQEVQWMTFEEWRQRQLDRVPKVPVSVRKYIKENKERFISRGYDAVSI